MSDDHESRPLRSGAFDTRATLGLGSRGRVSDTLVHCGECKWWDTEESKKRPGKRVCRFHSEGYAESLLTLTWPDEGDVLTHRTFGCVQGVRRE